MRVQRGLLVAATVAFVACTPLAAGQRADAGGEAGVDVWGDEGMDVALDTQTRCLGSRDCAGGAVCDPASGRCVECVATADTCPGDQHCVEATHRCAAGCRNDDGCSAPAGDGGAATRFCDVTTHSCVAVSYTHLTLPTNREV